MRSITVFLLSALIFLPGISQAQKKLVDRRDQATGWYVPVKFKVTTQRARAKAVDVKVYKDNKLVEDLPNSKDKFTVNLDLDHCYTVILSKEGYRSKSIYVNTHVPEQLVQYPAYECNMDLDPAERYDHSDPFYTDFPSAIVRWNDTEHGFTPQLDYLKDIQSKMALLQVQADPH